MFKCKNIILFVFFSAIMGICACGLFDESYKPPSNLKAFSNSPSMIKVTWEPTKCTLWGYYIERRVSGGFPDIIDDRYFGSEYFDLDVQCETTYFYRVRALCEKKNSGYSEHPGSSYTGYSQEVSATTGTCWKAIAIEGGENTRSFSHTGSNVCAITNNGGLVCWGDFEYGQLGPRYDPITDQRNYGNSQEIKNLSSGIKKVVVGAGHICALTDEGKVECWGNNDSGQLGVGTIKGPGSCGNYPYQFSCSTYPVQVIGLSGSIVDLSAGFNYTCALAQAGEVACWGNGVSVPVVISPINSVVKQVSAGASLACVLTQEEKVLCWETTYLYDLFPVGDLIEVFEPADEVLVISTGYRHVCGIISDGSVKCWGGDYGNAPVNINGVSRNLMDISSGERLTCVLNGDRDLECWWNNGYVYEVTDQGWRTSPDLVTVSGKNIVDFKVIYKGGLILTTGGSVMSWIFETPEPGCLIYGPQTVPGFILE